MNCRYNHIQPVKLIKTARVLVLILAGLFLGIIPNYAQCPEIQSDDYSIRVTSSGDTHSIRIRIEASELNLSDYRIQLYNFDLAVYHLDESGKENVVNDTGIFYDMNARGMQINNLPAGDYGVILLRQGCDQQVIGYGHSGFPHSAIQVGS